MIVLVYIYNKNDSNNDDNDGNNDDNDNDGNNDVAATEKTIATMIMIVTISTYSHNGLPRASATLFLITVLACLLRLRFLSR